MEKYIFLDFDGVMTSGKNYDALVCAGKLVRDEYGDLFDPQAVTNLQMILEATGADIVISSNWNVLGLGTMKAMWKKRGLPGKIVGVAVEGGLEDIDLASMDLEANIDFLMGQNLRGKAISGWLSRNAKSKDCKFVEKAPKSKDCPYVILDDLDAFTKEQQSHFVKVNPTVGLCIEDAVKAIEILHR